MNQQSPIEVPSSPLSDLSITVLDKPGPGGAYHSYRIGNFDTSTNPSAPTQSTKLDIVFQNGVIPEFGINGITLESLYEVIIHRLTCFQSGPFKNHYNQRALEATISALQALNERTSIRRQTGIEGKMIPDAPTED